MTSPLLGWTLLPAPWWRTSCATYTMTANRCVGLGGCGCGYVKKFDALVGRAVFATPAAVTFIGLYIFDVQWVID
jgi:hypothetical protein